MYLNTKEKQEPVNVKMEADKESWDPAMTQGDVDQLGVLLTFVICPPQMRNTPVNDLSTLHLGPKIPILFGKYRTNK